MKTRVSLPLALGLLALLPLLQAAQGGGHKDQDPARWEGDIQKFERQDLEQPPSKGGVLFVGSSTVRMWDTADCFPDLATLNRGFGGSQISDINHFADRIVWKYEPSVIVLYAGDNDLARGKTVETVVADYRQFAERVAARLPATHLVFLSIKPSLKRWELWPRMDEANRTIWEMSAHRHTWHYADLASPMLGEDGRPRPELFQEDGLHLNPQGYQLWTETLAPRLAGILTSLDLPLAQGQVYEDKNGNERRDAGEPALEGIRVSNGREIVRTDAQGRYRLPVDDDDIVFVVKPRGYRTRLTPDMLPHFYYIHKPHGSPDSRYPGVDPTGPLPASIDFPLYSQKEPEQFKAILFGDPQPRDQKEVDYVAHDVVQELIGTDASFGVTLGDIVFDDLRMFEPQNRAIALIGIPWYNVIGNHDTNMDARDDRHSDETFERIFGPSYYSFDYGPVHFIALDDIEWYVEQEGKPGRYRGGLGTEQMEFIRQDLALVPDDQLVVLMMHIPLTDVRDRHELYRLIEQRKFCMSISGHTHHHEHRYIQRADGWRGPQPHHHLINVTVSGSWWSGAPDERGIPHTMMADGAPNGYSILQFDGQRYRLDFKAAGRPADYQMNIQFPDEVPLDAVAETPVYANVFNGSERSTVEMRLGTDGPWLPMAHTREEDPLFKRISEAENAVPEKSWRNLPRAKPSSHLWKATLPSTVRAGTWLLQVRTTDEHGRQYVAGRVIRLLPSSLTPTR